MKKIILLIVFAIFFFFVYVISLAPNYESINISNALAEARSMLKDNQEIIVFDSKNPFNFHDIFNGMEDIADQQVFGILTKPNEEDVFSIVMGVAAVLFLLCC